jgi:amino acid transporter
MKTLRSQISLFAGTTIAVGMVVGSGVFGLPGLALQLSSPQIAALGWLICAAACFPLLCIFSVLGTRYACAGGISRYAEAALGRRAECGVAAVLCGTFPLVVPAQAMIGASYALVAFGLDQAMLLPMSAMLIFSALLFNLCGVRVASLINMVSLVLVITTVFVLCATRPADLTSGVFLWAVPDWSSVDLPNLWKVSALIFWAFLGWENISFGLEEFKDPQKTIKRTYFLSFLVVVVLYFFLAAIINGACVADSDVKATAGIANLVPAHWKMVFSVATFMVIMATANSWIFGASRLFYAAARDGILPEYFARLDERGVPRNALLLLAACFSSVLVIVSLFHVHIPDLVLLANQNFLILYLVCIYCFGKIARGCQRWLLTPAALLSCCFLLAGFSYSILYSFTLLAAGIVCARSRKRRWAGSVYDDVHPNA